ncbi:MAG: ABC transporter ATP-binding protein [Erysipelotrichia bacterium]|nr:ABC transporter ATP-binding protein [Erysipelotrichia bacterium]
MAIKAKKINPQKVSKDEIIISLKNISKEFDETYVVDQFNLDIKRGEFVTILGPSGCGKTTTLRMIAGFETPTSGEILLNGEDISILPPHKRPVNTVFQRYALFPHLDVYDNVAFGLKLKRIEEKVIKNDEEIIKKRRLSVEEIDDKVAKALKQVDLEDLEDRDVLTLSGGQQQRVAIARCLVNEPQILLLDEPLGALDLKMRQDMQLELKEMHDELGITFIYVTHDQEEALTMSDTIVVMKDGLIQQVGSPMDIYNEPANAFVADFIGNSNIYHGTMINTNQVRFLNYIFTCEDDFPKNEKVDVVVRPEDIIITKKDQGMINGYVDTKIFKGVHYEYVLYVGKSEVLVQSTKEFPIDTTVGLNIEPESIHVMKKEYTINRYLDAYINKHDEVIISEVAFPIDITQLVINSHVDEDGYVVNNKGQKYDFTDAEVIAEIQFSDVLLSDDLEKGLLTGIVVSSLYLGDHYQYIVRTIEEEEDFIVETQDLYNETDVVSIDVKKENIRLILKGDLTKYEV